MDVERAQKLPRSLEEAFQALESDDVMKAALGHRFVFRYVTAKRDYETKPFSQTEFRTEEEEIEYKRERYLISL